METVYRRSLTVWARLSIFPAPSLSDGLDGERLERAFSPAQNARHVAGQIDPRARLDAAGSRIDHQVELVLEPVADLARLGQRLRLAGQRQGGRKHRLAPPGGERTGERVAPPPDAAPRPSRGRPAAPGPAPPAPG